MIGRRDITPVSEDEGLKGFDDFDLRLGDVMRGERATLGKSLLDVQRELKIKAAYIAAIENSDPSAFESQGFVAGYVRSYARYLGLDPEWAYSRFCNESDFASTDGMSQAASTKPKKKQRAVGMDPLADPGAVYLPKAESMWSRVEPAALGSVLVLAMLLSALGYGGWAVFREIQKVQFVPVDQTPGIATDVDILGPATETAEPGTDYAAAPTTDAFDRLYRPSALEVPILTARDGPISTLNPADVGTLAPVAQDPPIAIAEMQSPIDDLAPAEEQATVQVVEAAASELVLFAVRPSWVRVRSADGTVLFEKILDAGEEYVLPQTEEPPILRAGNAGSVYFRVDGQTYGPAGDGPSVVKDLQLGSDNLIASYQQADPAADADLARFIAVAQAD